ncbi:hypothetical protein MKK63_26625 [Methylobacterium sp. J-088]|uniref:hypothetical protein n=1 Tax=Methylobacterium sp. J-088 TaxID=2836664 RepID=UPI001FBAD572|nr:hypothetical protein [Methylobacterium sp. J-088]MCJ2066243.1 hypothetical protein [Methylobacterium sp. J-088]
MRFPVMKYARSILVTTVLAVFGLGVATQNLHSRDRNAPTRPAAVAESIKPVAWIDPPARGTPEITAEPASEQLGALATAATPPATIALSVEPPRNSSANHRGKAAERKNRSRAAHLHRPTRARTAAADPAVMPQSAPRPAPDASGRIDPIGDILRGLGFGRDS